MRNILPERMHDSFYVYVHTCMCACVYIKNATEYIFLFEIVQGNVEKQVTFQ